MKNKNIFLLFCIIFLSVNLFATQQGQGKKDLFTPTYDDMQGILGTALTGGAQWTPTAYRTTGIVFNEVASGDFFTMIFQFQHSKKKSTNLDSIHIHCIPKGSTNGNIKFSYEWGWFNHNDIIPDTLPNSSSTADIALLTTDQYKMKYIDLITNLAFPTSEENSSILMVRITATAPSTGTNWWTGNRIALAYMDAHYIKDSTGSLNPTTD